MLNKTFLYRKQVFLRDITIFGNAYFANYFLWQGEAREAFLNSLTKGIDVKNLKLVTINAMMLYKNEVHLNDIISIEVRPSNISLTTVQLEFIFRKNNKSSIIATGTQKIGFCNGAGKILPLPSVLLERGKKYLNSRLASDAELIKQKLLKISL